MDWETEGQHKERPHSSDGVSAHTTRLAASKKTSTTFGKKILGLQRRTINRWWNAPERTEANHTGGTSRGVSQPSARRPSLSKRGTGECKTTYVLDRNRCGHRGLHQAMPGMYQKVSSSQGAPPASWHPRGPLEETWHWLFHLWWQLICLDLRLFLKVSLSLQNQNIILVIKGPSNWSLFNWRVSRRESIRQRATVPEQGVCQISLWLRHQAHHLITRVPPF